MLGTQRLLRVLVAYVSCIFNAVLFAVNNFGGLSAPKQLTLTSTPTTPIWNPTGSCTTPPLPLSGVFECYFFDVFDINVLLFFVVIAVAVIKGLNGDGAGAWTWRGSGLTCQTDSSALLHMHT